MSRWTASGIHLLLSAAIVAATLLFMLLVWYPWPLFEAAGGSHLAVLIAGVDVTIGPLITLIIFRAGKPGLRFDLTVIALLQLAALSYGIYSVAQARPVFLVFCLDRFELVTAKDLDPKDLAQVSDPEFRHVPWGRPGYIAVTAPKDAESRNQIMFSALAGKDLQLYPQYYVSYASLAADALARAKPIDTLRRRDSKAVDRYLQSSGRHADTLRYLPLRARQKDAAVLLDAVSGQPLRMLLIDPW